MACGPEHVTTHTCPVCGMKVKSTTPYKLVHNGVLYYFCSKACLEAFRENPDYYLTHGPQGMPG